MIYTFITSNILPRRINNLHKKNCKFSVLKLEISLICYGVSGGGGIIVFYTSRCTSSWAQSTVCVHRSNEETSEHSTHCCVAIAVLMI